MPFEATVNLGTVGSNILGETVSISSCTDASCSNCTLLLSDEPVSNFPTTISDIPDLSLSLFIQVTNGPCVGVSQCIQLSGSPNPFVSRWTATAPQSNTIELPYSPSGTYSGTIDWGDGFVSDNAYSARTRTYASPGDYIVTITGQIQGWNFGSFATTYRNNLKEITKWGTLRGSSNSNSNLFFRCQNLRLTGVTDTPILTSITSLDSMFRDCTSITTINLLNNWNVSGVTNMSLLFYSATSFNQNIGNWNTSAVTSTANMFSYASLFNNGGSSSIGNWNVTNISNMLEMFAFATSFNQNLGSWNLRPNGVSVGNLFLNATSFNNGGSPSISGWTMSAVTSTSGMFKNATSFNQPIGNWNMRSDFNTTEMFFSATSFNQNIGNWDLRSCSFAYQMFRRATSFNNGGSPSISGWTMSAATLINGMFYDAFTFNQPIGSWNVSGATNLSNMFLNAQAFNQPLSGWNVSRVTSFQQMFNGASQFNQNIGAWNMSAATNTIQMFWFATNFNNGGSSSINDWNVSGVTSFQTMFHSAVNFNQPIGNWDTRKVTNMAAMFYTATVFNQDISNWETSGVTSMNDMFGFATSFNRNLSSWCVTLIPTVPSFFAGGASSWSLPKPVWGTCPP
jgi:surface protein